MRVNPETRRRRRTEVVRRKNLALDDREVDLDLVQPTRMDGQMNELQSGTLLYIHTLPVQSTNHTSPFPSTHDQLPPPPPPVYTQSHVIARCGGEKAVVDARAMANASEDLTFFMALPPLWKGMVDDVS
jgi:hypothetical protein